MFNSISWASTSALLILVADSVLTMTVLVHPTVSSVNYTIQEYVNDSISHFVDAADKNDIPHPNVITESGRSLTAHHAVLVFEVLEATSPPMWNEEEEITDSDHELVKRCIPCGKTSTSPE